MQQYVLITGCSSGFGYLTAKLLASKGFHVYATMRDLKKNPFPKQQPNMTFLELDVTKQDSIAKAFKQVKQLDVLVNNAGYVQAGLFEDITESQLRKQMDTNFFGVFNVTKAALPLLKKSKHAKIINISSVSGKVAAPGLSAYSASKFALEALGESTRFELAKYGIKVFLIEPGAYDTNIFKKNLEVSLPKKSAGVKRALSIVQKRSRKHPEEVAKLIYKLICRGGTLRHVIGSGFFFRIRKALPFSMVERGVARFMKKL